eukprot:gene1092-839_t
MPGARARMRGSYAATGAARDARARRGRPERAGAPAAGANLRHSPLDRPS